MAGKKNKGNRPGASLTDLLKEHTRVAEQEKADLEKELRERDEEERRRKEEEAQKQRELLRARLEEEKQRAQARFSRAQERAGGSEAEGDGKGEADSEQAPRMAPAGRVMAPAAGGGRVALAAVLAIVITAGLAVGAYFLLLNDRSAALSTLERQPVTMQRLAQQRASALAAYHATTQTAAAQEAKIQQLNDELAALKSTLSATEQAKAAAEAKAAEEAKKREAEEASSRGNGRRSRKKSDDGSIKVRKDIFGGRKIVE